MKHSQLNRPLVHLVLLLALGLAAYSNTFEVPFHFDDNIVLGGTRFKDIGKVPSMFVDIEGPWASRPLLHATMALNYYIGGLDTTGYHVLNLALHLINGALIYLLVLMTGRFKGVREDDLRPMAALASMLFVLHPAQTEAVIYISSRSMLLSTTFYFLGMLLFLKAATAERRKALYATGLFAASVLGMASRENFATFPLMLVLYDVFFVSGFRLKDLSSRYKLYIPVALSLGYFVFLAVNNTFTPRSDTPGAGIEPANYTLTALRAHWTYLRLLVLPVNQNLDYDYPEASAIFETRTLAALLGYAGLWLSAIVFSRRRPVASFATLWFLITLIPISFGVALFALNLDDVIFEHRLYLPGAATIVAFSCGAVLLRNGLKGAPRALASALSVALVLTLACATYSRNSVWQSRESLWQDAVAKSPNKARVYNNLADAYVAKGEPERAVKLLKKALYAERYNPEVQVHHYGLARALMDMGRVKEAIEQYQFALNISPNFAEAHNGIALAYISVEEYGRAEEHLSEAIRIKPGYADAHSNLGALYSFTGRHEEGIRQLLKAIEINPENVNAYINLGGSYSGVGELEKAIEYYRTALRLDPDSQKAKDSLNSAYLRYRERHRVRKEQ